MQKNLAADECKAGAQLQQEARDVPGDGALDVSFLSFLAQSEKIEEVRILE